MNWLLIPIDWTLRKVLPRGRAMTISYQLRHPESPLEFRSSIKMLSRSSHHPYLDYLGLLWPIPWYYASTLPPPPREIAAYPENEYFDNWPQAAMDSSSHSNQFCRARQA